MNIKSLQLFIHLCDSKSFSKTAAAMHVSPSALSRQVQKLEEETGQELLIRDNRSVDLTPAGKHLLPVALSIVGEWQQYNLHLKGGEQELKGEIRIFCSVTASYSHLPELITEFRAIHPYIEFKLSTGDPAQSIDKILNDEADIAISAKPDILPSRLEFETISDIPLSVIIVDIDYFKAYNDTYGHQQGDTCIQHVTQAMSHVFHRSTDTVARYGGEEFVALLFDTPASAAQALAEKLRKEIESKQIPHRSSPLGHVTVSLGCCTWTPDSEFTNGEEILNQADKALYQSKESGRNKLSVCPKTPPSE